MERITRSEFLAKAFTYGRQLGHKHGKGIVLYYGEARKLNLLHVDGERHAYKDVIALQWYCRQHHLDYPLDSQDELSYVVDFGIGYMTGYQEMIHWKIPSWHELVLVWMRFTRTIGRRAVNPAETPATSSARPISSALPVDGPTQIITSTMTSSRR